jgi:hypothetical protein
MKTAATDVEVVRDGDDENENENQLDAMDQEETESFAAVEHKGLVTRGIKTKVKYIHNRSFCPFIRSLD